jgi:hypothetical protein
VILTDSNSVGALRLDRGEHQTGAELVIDEVPIHFANVLYKLFGEISDLDFVLFEFPPTTSSYVWVRIEYPDYDLANAAVDQPETARRLVAATGARLQRRVDDSSRHQVLVDSNESLLFGVIPGRVLPAKTSRDYFAILARYDRPYHGVNAPIVLGSTLPR